MAFFEFDQQTVLALIIVVAVAARVSYKWLMKRKQKKSQGCCGCEKSKYNEP